MKLLFYRKYLFISLIFSFLSLTIWIIKHKLEIKKLDNLYEQITKDCVRKIDSNILDHNNIWYYNIKKCQIREFEKRGLRDKFKMYVQKKYK